MRCYRWYFWDLSALLLLSLLTAPQVGAVQTTRLTNGDMELAGKGDAHVPGWQDYLWEGHGRINHTSAASFQGRRSVSIDGSGPGKIGLFQQVEVDACSYRLTAMVSSSRLTTGKDDKSAAVYVVPQGRQTIFYNLFSGDNGWRHLAVKFNVPRKGPLVIYFFNYGGGHFFVDNVRLVPIASCPKIKDELAFSEQAVAPLEFIPFTGASDYVLAGYCANAAYAKLEVCLRITGSDSKRLSPSQEVNDLIIANFEDRQPFSKTLWIVPDRRWSLTKTALAGSASALLMAGGKMIADSSTGLKSDWRGYSWLRFNVANPGDRPQKLYIELHDHKSKDYWSRVNWHTMVPPGQSVVQVPLQNFVGEKLVIYEPRRLDLGHITRMVISAESAEFSLTIDDVRLSPEPPFVNDFSRLIKLDFGSPTSPLMPGFNRVTAATTYRPYRGYGLSNGVRIGQVKDRRHPGNLLRDWISFRSGGLDFDLPNGEYHVWLMLEDPGYWGYFPNFRRRRVWAERQIVLDERPSIDDFLSKFYRHAETEDLPGDDVWTRYIQPRYRPLEFNVIVKDGQLNIRFNSDYNPLATALSAAVIYPAADKVLGEKFITELWQSLKRQYDAEHLQIARPLPKHPLPAANALNGDLWIFRRSMALDVQATDWPSEEELTDKLSVSVSQGEYEPLPVGLFSATGLQLTGAELDLPGLEVTPYKVRYKLTRATDDGNVYWNIPRILDPLLASTPQPLSLSANQARSLWFDVYAPKGGPTGTVSGQLRLLFADGRAHDVPVSVDVRPWELPEADVPIGYMGITTIYPETTYPAVAVKRDAEALKAVSLLRRFGMTAFTGGFGGPRLIGYYGDRLRMDFSDADKTMKLLRRFYTGEVNTYFGMQIENLPSPDISKNNGRPYSTIIRDVLTAVRERGSTKNWLPLMHSIGDEPDGDSINEVVAIAKAFKQADSSIRTGVFTDLIEPYNDRRKAFAGVVTRLYLNNHSETAVRYIRNHGSECALYNQQGRYRRGVYLFKLRQLGCRGHLAFAFHSPHVDHYYSLDGREEDYMAVFEDRDGQLRPTLDLIRYREAIDDYRYLLKLEQSIATASAGPDTEAAQDWLESLLAKIEVGTGKTEAWTDTELDSVRQEATAFIAKLTARGPKPKTHIRSVPIGSSVGTQEY